jgi:hypothetical protein
MGEGLAQPLLQAALGAPVAHSAALIAAKHALSHCRPPQLPSLPSPPKQD